MNTAIDIGLELKMSSKKDYIENFDQKFDAVFDVIDLPNLSLFEIIENIKSLTFSVDSDLVQIIIQKKLDYIVSEPLCSCCVSRLHKKYTRKKEIETTIGSMSFDCPYLFCPQCKAYHTPYEDILNLRPGKYQYDVQKVAALLSSKDTYEESADMLNEIYRFGISPDTVHHLAGEVASRVNMVEIIPSSDEIRNIVEQISSKQHRKPIFVFAADGAMAPIRAEEKGVANCWKEVKGIRGYLLDKKQIVHLFSWHQISDKAEFASYLQYIKEQRLIPLDKVRLCFIGDGAGWIWDTVQAVFPDCRQVLDYFHCAQHLHDFAHIQFGQNTQAREWVEQAKVRLFHNNIAGVLIGLGNLKCRTAEAQKARTKLVGYLKGNKARIDYGKLRRGGYPLGSGAIESANKFICHMRLKRSGAWWKIDNANNVLKLRCAKYNAKFDDVFEMHEAVSRKQPHYSAVTLKRIK